MRILDLACVIALGAGLGLASARWAVAERPPVGRVAVGAWSAWPASGQRNVDPYMRAFLARGLHLPLGAGEGLSFFANRDEDGRPLDGSCLYRIVMATPPVRGWTLGVEAPAGTGGRVRAGFSDAEIVRAEDGSAQIVAAAALRSGNWLPLPEGSFALRLTLYDTPVVGHARELGSATLPRILRGGCG